MNLKYLVVVLCTPLVSFFAVIVLGALWEYEFVRNKLLFSNTALTYDLYIESINGTAALYLYTSLAVVTFLLIFARIDGSTIREVFALSKAKGSISRDCILAILIYVLLSSSVFYFAGSTISSTYELVNNSHNYIFFLIVILAAPIFEELIFRGYLFKVFEGLPSKGKVLITSILFSCAHLPQELYSFLGLLLLGALLGEIRVRTRSVYPVIFLHALNNSLFGYWVIFIGI